MVYLLRFTRPLGDPSRPGCHARYYLGWCPDGPGRSLYALFERIAEHRAGRGAAITAAAVAVGAQLQLVRTWPGADRARERAMKKNGPARYAPAWLRRLDRVR